MMPLYTIGHSNHPWQEFVAVLDRCQVELLIDVRSHPGSRKNSQFNRQHMTAKLGSCYFFMGDTLGGRMDGVYGGKHFPKHHIAQQREATGDRPEWTNVGLYEFAKYMGGPNFLHGFEQLEQLVGVHSPGRVAIMCAELHWWRCHRSMIADCWVGRGGEAIHLWPNGRETSHRQVLGNRLERYDEQTRQLWT